MCECVFCVCMRVYTCICVRMYVCIDIDMHTPCVCGICMCVYLCIPVHVCASACMHVHARVCLIFPGFGDTSFEVAPAQFQAGLTAMEESRCSPESYAAVLLSPLPRFFPC